MKVPYGLLAGAAMLLGSFAACADDTDHFRKFKVPADEARILALTGVREFRCDYEIDPYKPMNFNGIYQEDFELFAEVYAHEKCVGRYRLASAVNGLADPHAPLKGIFSFGWNEEKHQLVSVIDNAQFYSPWSKSMTIPSFSYCDYFFFENSKPEKRTSGYPSADNFSAYPVAGICGMRNSQMSTLGVEDVAGYLKVCELARADNVIIVYLYKGIGGGSAPLKFSPAP
jgi:hypothetical protein